MHNSLKLDLRDVTICAADTRSVNLAARAIHLSMAQCTFGDAILFTDAPCTGSFRTIQITQLASREAYSDFVLQQLPAAIQTPFALIVQWDGYVVQPSAWRSEFREYDYIGAKWPWHQDGMRVGNGGFSLRSQKLLRALCDSRFSRSPGIAEDEFICREHRSALAADFGIQFAPEEVADRFSYERALPDAPTFGFHGLFNMWRHTDDAEMVALVGQLGPHVFRSREPIELLVQYYVARKFGPLLTLYTRLRAEREPADIHRNMMGILNNEQLVQRCIFTCERLLTSAMDSEK